MGEEQCALHHDARGDTYIYIYIHISHCPLQAPPETVALAKFHLTNTRF